MVAIQRRGHQERGSGGNQSQDIVEKARTAFAIQGDEDGLELETPEGFNGFEIDPARKLRVIQWLEDQAGL